MEEKGLVVMIKGHRFVLYAVAGPKCLSASSKDGAVLFASSLEDMISEIKQHVANGYKKPCA